MEDDYNTPIKEERQGSMENVFEESIVIKDEESIVIKDEEIEIKEEYEESPMSSNKFLKNPDHFNSFKNIKVSSSEKCFPPGWTVKTVISRKRGTKTRGTSQKCNNQYISPEGKVFTNCKEVEENMKKMGIYTEDDIIKARGCMIYMNLKS